MPLQSMESIRLSRSEWSHKEQLMSNLRSVYSLDGFLGNKTFSILQVKVMIGDASMPI